MRQDGIKDVAEGMVGAAGMALAFLTPMLRGVRSHWGVSKELAMRPHPGDAWVPNPRWSWTHGIEIEASADRVWPWVAQIGQDRAGFYSYQWLENLVGCDIRNAEEIHPDWQGLRVGDGLKLHRDLPAAPIVELAEGRHFVVAGTTDLETGESRTERPPRFVALSWLFLVEALAPERARFISRFRTDYSDDLATRLQHGPTTESVGFVMDRKMLLGIKARAEARIIAYAPHHSD